MMKNKDKTENTFPPDPSPSSQAQLHFFIPKSTTTPASKQRRGMGNGGCRQSMTAPLCHCFLILFPCSSMGTSFRLQSFKDCSSMIPFHGVQSFKNRLFQRWSPMEHRSCRKTAPAWAPLHRLQFLPEV